MMLNKIGILGGTFDPIHNGHISMALNVIKEFDLDQLLVIPSYIPPHKFNINITPYNKRVEMCRIATEEYSNICVSTIEQELDGISFTYKTLNALKELYPDAQLYYIIGGDTLLELNTWYRPDLLAKLATFICIKRPATDTSMYETTIEQLKKGYGLIVLISEYVGQNISSTMIREHIKDNKPVDNLIPEGVLRYVNDECIYR